MAKRRPVSRQIVYLKDKIPVGTMIKFKYNKEFYIISGYGIEIYKEKHQALEQNSGTVGLFDFGEENHDYEVIQ